MSLESLKERFPLMSAALDQAAKNNSAQTTSRFGFYYLDRDEVSVNVTDICHAQLNHRIERERPEKFGYYTCFNPVTSSNWSPGEKEGHRRWVEFLVNPDKSPFKKVLPYLVFNDVDDLIEMGAFFTQFDKIAWSDLFLFSVAARQWYEHSNRLENWTWLQDEQGFTPAEAAWISFGWRTYGYEEERPTRDRKLSGFIMDGHQFLGRPMFDCKRFVTCKPRSSKNSFADGRVDGKEATTCWYENTDGVREYFPGGWCKYEPSPKMSLDDLRAFIDMVTTRKREPLKKKEPVQQPIEG